MFFFWRKKNGRRARWDSELYQESHKVQSNFMTTVQRTLANSSNNLMDEVVCHENIEKAIKCVENNKGAAGIDKMQVAELKH